MQATPVRKKSPAPARAASEPALFASASSGEDPHRLRLLDGFARAMTEKSYAAATIADIVRHARVSKRTFYEHFPDKESCFLAVYAAASELTLAAIAAAAAVPADWEAQLDAAVRAYLTTLELRPALTRTCLLEIQSAGDDAIRVRRHVQHAFAEQLRSFVEVARARHPELHALDPIMAAAVVGGINELVLLHVESGPSDRLLELAETALDLVRAVLLAPARRARAVSPLDRGRRKPPRRAP